MAKKKGSEESDAPNSGSTGNEVAGKARLSQSLREPAETQYVEEIDVLIASDKYDRPLGWRMSPRSVLTYICGGTASRCSLRNGFRSQSYSKSYRRQRGFRLSRQPTLVIVASTICLPL